MPVFSHEVVPDHLRTKPDPEVEEQEKQLTTDAARIGADAAQVGLSHCSATSSSSFISKTLPRLCRGVGLLTARLPLEEHNEDASPESLLITNQFMCVTEADSELE